MQGSEIKALRGAEGYHNPWPYATLEDMAVILGVSRRTMLNIEAGRSKPGMLQRAILVELKAHQKQGILRETFRSLKQAIHQYPRAEESYGWRSSRKLRPEEEREQNDTKAARAVLALLFTKPRSLFDEKEAKGPAKPKRKGKS